MKQFTLSNSERLKSRKQIDHLFDAGKYFNSAPLRVIYDLEKEPKPDSLKFGVGVSAKHFKKAVDRNRVKRLVREAWRVQKLPLANQLKEKNIAIRVFIIYTGRELPDHLLISEKIGSAIQRLVLLINETDTTLP